MRKLNITIVAGLLAALIGAALVFVYSQRVDQRVADGKEQVEVVVATADIPAGTSQAQLAAMTTTEKRPKAYVATGYLSSLDPSDTRVTSGPIAANSVLSDSDFAAAGTGAASVVQPAEGSVALAVSVGITPGVARYVSPGSTVDVFVTYQDTKVTKLFASAVKVLSISVAQVNPSASPGTTAAQPVDQVLAVLELTPATAEQVVNATTLGDVYLALTSGDQHTTGAGGTTPDDVVAGGQ